MIKMASINEQNEIKKNMKAAETYSDELKK